MDIKIYPPEEMVEVSIDLPLSKSMSARALIMNAMTPGAAPLAQVADCDDTRAMSGALAMMGGAAAGDTLKINVGPAGTAMRFLTAYAASQPGLEVELDGNERMRQRPIGPLVDALRQCGANIEYLGAEGFPPLRISGSSLRGGDMAIDASVSSQFVSALVMVAPAMSSPLRLTLQGQISSLPYLDMTLAMMRQRSVGAERAANVVTVSPSAYLPTDAPIERDWSAASYWYQIAAMSAGWVTLPGLTLPSLQGDSAVAKIFMQLGVMTEMIGDGAELNPSPEVFSRLDMDLSDTPDVVQTLAVTCCLLGVPFRFSGISTLRIKETDRLEALRAELAKLSFDVEIDRGDVLCWEGGRVPVMQIEPIDTHGDHRMAMAFAPVCIFAPGLMIRDAEVVGKSYPGYWQALEKAGFRIEADA